MSGPSRCSVGQSARRDAKLFIGHIGCRAEPQHVCSIISPNSLRSQRLLQPNGLPRRNGEKATNFREWYRGLVPDPPRSEEHTSELQSRLHLVCRLLLEKKKNKENTQTLTQNI